MSLPARRAPGPWEQLSVALARRLVGRRSPASCYSRTRRTGQQEPKNSLARRASQAPEPASCGSGSPVAAASYPASRGQRHHPARHGHLCPCRVPALPPRSARPLRPPTSLPSGAPSPPSIWPFPRLKGPLCPGDTPSSSPPQLTSRPLESPQHLGCPLAVEPLAAGYRPGTQQVSCVQSVVPRAAVAPWTCHVGRVTRRRGPACGLQAKCLGISPNTGSTLG